MEFLVFPIHPPSIPHGVQTAVGSLWLGCRQLKGQFDAVTGWSKVTELTTSCIVAVFSLHFPRFWITYELWIGSAQLF